MTLSNKIEAIEPLHDQLSVRQLCQLLGVNRSYYFEPKEKSDFNFDLMKRIDKEYLEPPFYGSRRMAVILKSEG